MLQHAHRSAWAGWAARRQRAGSSRRCTCWGTGSAAGARYTPARRCGAKFRMQGSGVQLLECKCTWGQPLGRTACMTVHTDQNAQTHRDWTCARIQQHCYSAALFCMCRICMPQTQHVSSRRPPTPDPGLAGEPLASRFMLNCNPGRHITWSLGTAKPSWLRFHVLRAAACCVHTFPFCSFGICRRICILGVSAAPCGLLRSRCYSCIR